MRKLDPRVLLVALLLLVGGMSDAGAAQEKWSSRPVEIRAVWMDRRSIPKTEQGIRELMRDYAKAGINVLHPEVIYNGYAAYRSSYLPQQDLWDGLDMLGILVDEAHKHNMEVHPWVWVFRVGNVNDKRGILQEHPDWVAVNRKGESLARGQAYWLCPSIPAARRLLLGAIRELAQKYPIDGVQLDYIRFDSQEYCYNESCRAKFKAAYGMDPLEIKPFTKPVLDWHLWREDLVNSFVAEARAELGKVRPGIKVSAAVASFPDGARVNFLQNWGHWAANRWVDFLAPMDYTPDPTDFLRRVRTSLEGVGNKTLLAPGLGLHLMKGCGPMLEQVRVARSEPASGVSLFATAYLDSDRLEALGEGPFRKKARLPFRSPLKGAKELVSSARARLAASATYENVSQARQELESAKNLLGYLAYRVREPSYVPPTAPPIFIPAEIQPIPAVEIPAGDTAPAIDGRLNDAAWQKAARAQIELTNLGKRSSKRAEVLLTYDDENLYVAFRAVEPNPDSVRARVVKHDGPLFNDDSVEIFLGVQDRAEDYFHFALNALGTTYEARGLDVSWGAEWQAAVGREPKAWTAEIAIPFASLGVPVPGSGTVWHGNFCRNRAAAGNVENTCWSATYGSHHTPIRFGTLAFRTKTR